MPFGAESGNYSYFPPSSYTFVLPIWNNEKLFMNPNLWNN